MTDKRVLKRQGGKQILRHINNPKYLRLLVQRGEYSSRLSTTVDNMDRFVARFEALGYIVTKEADL